MWDLIVIGILYVLSVALFRSLGGFGAAGDAFRTWGRSHAATRVRAGSSSG
jgi:hypothetical protein